MVKCVLNSEKGFLHMGHILLYVYFHLSNTLTCALEIAELKREWIKHFLSLTYHPLSPWGTETIRTRGVASPNNIVSDVPTVKS